MASTRFVEEQMQLALSAAAAIMVLVFATFSGGGFGVPVRVRRERQGNDTGDTRPPRDAGVPGRGAAPMSLAAATTGFLGHVFAPRLDSLWVIVVGEAFALLLVAIVALARDTWSR